MDEINEKAKGLRKAGIGITAIGTIAFSADLTFQKTVVIATIAIIGIIGQCILDWRNPR